ncbi:YEATS domain-containing protein [Saccharomycopsis crataegensis]|uniref:Protein AF-9 homolog n=1 Tax=Saccharomycopsis crataegensis TaxID=43959 RepID=A0AAV5QVR1_9ASCO|nr:YEATS domain-containing protein [Saccharomycopsis crataegensis]
MAPHVKRVKNISISRPIIYGNTASPFDATNKPSSVPSDHTHSWTVFVRDPTKSQDLSMIKKVVFKLHDTIRNPLRTIESPPFEITETGWGEFEVIIKIFFQPESNEKPVQFYHHLKLHPYNPQVGESGGTVPVGSGSGVVNPDGTVESVLYDELMFNEPTEDFFKILTNKPGHLLNSKKTTELVYSDELEQEELFRINNALGEVQEQILSARKKIQELEFTNKQRIQQQQEQEKEQEHKQEQENDDENVDSE